MRIIGPGIDLQDMRRIEKLLPNPHNDWLGGVFSEDEQAEADAPPNAIRYYAGRSEKKGQTLCRCTFLGKLTVTPGGSKCCAADGCAPPRTGRDCKNSTFSAH